MRVLLVDDDDLVRATLVEMLNGVGYEVLEAGDPNQALGLKLSVRPMCWSQTSIFVPN